MKTSEFSIIMCENNNKALIETRILIQSSNAR